MTGHEKRPTAKQVVRTLIADEGWIGLYRGLGPRFFSMSAWGTSMILAYEYLSKYTFFFLILVISIIFICYPHLNASNDFQSVLCLFN